MSFKTLEQRYNEKVNDLYRGATSKFENGRASRGANDDPIIVRKPGDGYFGGASRALGRFLPVSSTVQDVKRLTLFTFSTRGAVFLAKQFLLQTGNTFEATRLLNPAFTIANAVPFLHVRRHLTPGAIFSGLIGRTDTDASSAKSNVRSMGQLQQGTYDKLTGNPASIFGSITSAFTAKRNVGWLSQITPFDMKLTWNISRPELKDDKNFMFDRYFISSTVANNPLEQEAINNPNSALSILDKSSFFKFGGRNQKVLEYSPTEKYFIGTTISPTPNGRNGAADYNPSARTKDLNAKYVNNAWQNHNAPLDDVRSNLTSAFNATKTQYIIAPISGSIVTQTEAYKSITNPVTASPFIRRPLDKTIKAPRKSGTDNSNERIDLKTAATKNIKFPYDSFNDTFTDYINVQFEMGRELPVRFRAYLKDLQQSISPQYKEFQYVGRTEKFVSYTGAQREVSFKLGVLAENKAELNEVWKRINYLTGLAFPYGVSNGIYQPNVMRLTIGKVFLKQPAYITSVSTNFSEIMESWDIDSEVPMSAQVDMKCVLIEKTQKVANSPFYGITENYFKQEYRDRIAQDLTPSSATSEVIK
jgi:hypothetical protein